MKKHVLITFLMLLTVALFAQSEKNKKNTNATAETAEAAPAPPKPAPVELRTAADSASYAFGVLIAQNIKQQMPSEILPHLLIVGLETALRNEPTRLSESECSKIYSEFNRQILLKAGEANRVEGEKFLASNKNRKGVKVTPSGLQYEVIAKGAGGPSPKVSDKVKVHYHGTLISGEVFDSSVDRGQPAVFGLQQVISGWTEGLQLMQVGDKYRFYIPHNLAYGERSAGAKIKPFSTLIFDVELISIEK